MFHKVLIANRGAIACRIIRTLRKLGVKSVAVYSDADRHSLHVAQADESVHIGPSHASQSYLSIDAVIGAARKSGAEAIHPGYGFLSEKPEFAEACDAAGIVFIGPTAEQMRTFALKHTARKMAADLGIPLLPGTGLLRDIDEAREAADRIGYPVMLKSTAGGGGIGIRLCRNDEDLGAAFDAVRRLGESNFGDSGAFLERYIERARHLEVQIFGDGSGHVVALGERDCSAQRRNQKVIEETPAPGINPLIRQQLSDTAVRIGRAVNYRSAGTVEYVYDDDTGEFYFLEVNTRLQVEHGVTEQVAGVDLVEWMVRLASGDLATLTSPPPSLLQRGKQRLPGHSIEVRLYAEDAGRDFQPSSGRLTYVEFTTHARVETWVETGTEITPYYDPMIAKIIVDGADRPSAITALASALAETHLAGIETNRDYLRQVCASPEFQKGGITTSFLSTFRYDRAVIEVQQGGMQTTVQDYPGRLGYWNVGVPPSGPMDSLAFRLANRLVGNDESAAGIEMTLSGPELRFSSSVVIALTGAWMSPTLDGEPVPYYEAVQVPAGSVLKMERADGAGMRAYLSVAGGIDVGTYLGSSSTFMLGKFGGHDGRALRSGDVIHLLPESALRMLPGISDGSDRSDRDAQANTPIGQQIQPAYANHWRIGVLYGPHGAPDFFQDADIEMLFATDWKVHHHSDRTGVRLIGPKPQWARRDGGEAGLHPSNIHDNAYAVGTIDFTGDMPIILGPDGPSLGGFVCPATIVHAELWKIGQLRPGDTVRFQPVSHVVAERMDVELSAAISSLTTAMPELPTGSEPGTHPGSFLASPPEAGGGGVPMGTEPAILTEHLVEGNVPALVCRADGDRNLLIEFGPNVLDISLRLRGHTLESKLRDMALPGIIDITPGIRSLQVHYNPVVLPREELLRAVTDAERKLPQTPNITIPSRVVHMPLSWDDPATRLAAEKYMQTVRRDAPWCPDNIEFIRRINGLDSIDDVQRIIFDANYLVMGLGDVYLGAPVATPLDPRHRLVTTKYNPARTWTPENAVGIGGAYLCVYGMEGPGGYQLFGRTAQVWNTFKSTLNFEPGTPWLLRFFDQIRFYSVSAAELLEIRDAFPHGEYSLRVESTEFRSGEYLSFLSSIEESVHVSRTRQQEAFEAERARWVAAGQMVVVDPIATDDDGAGHEAALPDGCEGIASPMTSSVWKILVQAGQRVQAGDGLLVLEAMKTETLVTAPFSGTVEEVRTRPDMLVSHGQYLVVMRRV